MALKKMGILSVNLSTQQGKWKEPFNQATFINYDTNSQVIINTNIIIPPAAVNVTTGNVYPTVFQISLNTEEINDEYYTFDFQGSSSANLQVIYTWYKDMPV